MTLGLKILRTNNHTEGYDPLGSFCANQIDSFHDIIKNTCFTIAEIRGPASAYPAD